MAHRNVPCAGQFGMRAIHHSGKHHRRPVFDPRTLTSIRHIAGETVPFASPPQRATTHTVWILHNSSSVIIPHLLSMKRFPCCIAKICRFVRSEVRGCPCRLGSKMSLVRTPTNHLARPIRVFHLTFDADSVVRRRLRNLAETPRQLSATDRVTRTYDQKTADLCSIAPPSLSYYLNFDR